MGSDPTSQGYEERGPAVVPRAPRAIRPPRAPTHEELTRLRAHRFGLDGTRKLLILVEAAAFVRECGLALVWPADGVDLPSLYEARRGRVGPAEDWDRDADDVWRWRYEMPARQLAGYARPVHGQPTLISPELLAAFVALAGDRTRLDGFRRSPLSPPAMLAAQILLERGPVTTKLLREEFVARDGMFPGRLRSALDELEDALWVVRCGSLHAAGPAWPAERFDLLPRAFPRAAREAVSLLPGAARDRIADALFRTAVVAHPKPLERLLGWTTDHVRDAVASLEHRGHVVPLEPRAGFPYGSYRTTALA